MNRLKAGEPRKRASRHGRYRKSLLSPQSLQPVAKSLENIFNKLDDKRLEGLLSDAEFLGYGLLTLLACRRADAFQSNETQNQKNAMLTVTSSSFTLSDFWKISCSENLPLGDYQKRLDQKIPLRLFLDKVRFRGIPDSAQIALTRWLDHQYPLTLLFHIPSTSEVFELQKKGGRCISFLKQYSELIQYHHDRDAISFIVHDLIHAHEFYALPERARQQIGFYHWLDGIQHCPALLKLQTESDKFRQCWEYVLSDMNSYCGHLLKTLNAAFTIHARPGEGEWLWKNIVDFSTLEAEEKILFQKINSVTWCEADFLYLESILEKQYQRAASKP